MLKVSPWKSIIRFGKRGKLNLWYIGPFKILARIGAIAYRLELPQELSGVHNTFHVSNMKRSEGSKPTPSRILKLLDSLYLDGENRENAPTVYYNFPFATKLCNWVELVFSRSISIWEDLTTRFLAQFFPPGRTAKLRNDILMFQQHHGESLSEAWTRFKDLLQKFPHHGIDLLLQLRDLNAEESWALLEDLTLYDNEIWNDPRDPAKPVKAIALPQDVPSTSDRRLIELENQCPHELTLHEWKLHSPQEHCSNQSRRKGGAQELSKNPSAPKRVHFVNSIVILSTNSETEEEDISLTHTYEDELGYMVRRSEEVEDKGKEEDEMETDVEVEEVIEEKESEFETNEEIE
ncbi:zinc finger, CCHC-type containing protein [Tanacetum coccineum]